MTRTILVSRAHQLAAQLLVERGEVTGRAVPDAVRSIAEMDRSADQRDEFMPMWAQTEVAKEAAKTAVSAVRAAKSLRDVSGFRASVTLPPGPARIGRVVSVDWDAILASHLDEETSPIELSETQSGSEEAEPEINETLPAAPDDGHQSEIGDLVVRHVPGSGWVRRNKLIGY